MIDVPQILPRGSGLAYDLFLAAMRDGKSLYTDGRVILIARRKPASNFRRMGCVDRNDGGEAA